MEELMPPRLGTMYGALTIICEPMMVRAPAIKAVKPAKISLPAKVPHKRLTRDGLKREKPPAPAAAFCAKRPAPAKVEAAPLPPVAPLKGEPPVLTWPQAAPAFLRSFSFFFRSGISTPDTGVARKTGSSFPMIGSDIAHLYSCNQCSPRAIFCQCCKDFITIFLLMRQKLSECVRLALKRRFRELFEGSNRI